MEDSKSNKIAIQRLTALWALNESGLGGLLHAFNSPFTGIIVGSIAIILICLICQLSEDKLKTILSALTIVLIVKAGVSPHSNLTAYFAVSFQAVMGAFLFNVIKSNLLACTLLAIISLVESSVQKLLGWTIVYGKTFWEAVDDFGSWLSMKIGYLLPFAASKAVIIIYISIHAIAGLIIGIFSAKLIGSVKENWNNDKFKIILNSEIQLNEIKNQKPAYKSVYLWLGIIFTMILLMIYGYYTDGWKKGLYILLRTVAILGFLYLILGPFILKRVNKYLSKKKGDLGVEINQVFALFPYLRYLIRKSWTESKSKGIFSRWYRFILYTLLYVLHFKKEA